MSDFPVIAVEGLTKYYGSVVGIRDVSFSVEGGEIFGFLGPNGAGKTTTIRLLLDLLRPSGGKIYYWGKEVSRNSTVIRRSCGYLPGNFIAYRHMKGAEFLRFAARLRGISPKMLPKLLERFGLSEEDLSRKIKHLSHGTLQKVGIVQAFFHEPELLILDEPTMGLDPLMQEEFYKLLHEFQEAGSTIFFSSHNLTEVEKVCQRAAIVRGGELAAVEALEDLKKKRCRKLRLTLRQPLDLTLLAGAQLIKKEGLKYEFFVKGSMEALLKSLSDLPVEDVVFCEPDLEEVFRAYYRNTADE